MVLGHDEVCCFDVGDQHVSIFNIDSEFSLQGFVHLDRCFNVNESSLVSPVRIE